MPVFSYTAISPSGARASGEVRAIGQSQAIDQLVSRQLTVVTIDAARHHIPWWSRELSFSSAPSQRASVELVRFLTTLSLMLGAGFALVDALLFCERQEGIPTLRAAIKRVREAVEDGEPAGVAFTCAGPALPERVTALLSIGDRSNRLAETATALAATQRRDLDTRQRVLSAMLYPCLLLVMSLLVLSLLVFYLAPTLAPAFEAAGETLPGTLGTMLWVNRIARESGFSIFLAVVLVGAIGWLVGARLRPFTRELSYRLPLLKRFARRRLTLVLAQSLGIVLKSGIPVSDGISELEKASADPQLRAVLKKAHSDLADGLSLSEALHQERYLDQSLIIILGLADSVNKLGELLDFVENSLATDRKEQTDRIVSMLTPALTLAIGVLIGSLVLATISSVMALNDIAL